MKAQVVRFIKHGIVLGLAATLIGVLLLVLVFCLPTERMTEHVFESVDEMLLKEEQIPESGVGNYIANNREMFTDAIMVQNVIENIDGKNAYEHAMWVYHRDHSNEVIWMPEESLRTISEGGDTSAMYLRTYARYWHGYLVYLKPLLMLFTWEQVVNLGVAVQILLLLFVIAAAIYKKHPEVAVATILGLMFMKPILVHLSLTMSVCWVITLIALAYQLFRHEWLLAQNYYAEFFLIIGIVTAYFDFLTYPVVTLGFPLCTYFLLMRAEKLKEIILRTLGSCIGWGLGYAGMWAMKWIVADVTLQTGTIKDAVWSIIGRTEAIGGRPRFNGGFYVIGLNLQEYDLPIYVVVAIILAAITLFLAVIACVKADVKKVLIQIIPFLVIFCIPFAWIVVVQHHSALHARFTFRILSVAIMSLGCMGAVAIDTIRKSCKNK